MPCATSSTTCSSASRNCSRSNITRLTTAEPVPKPASDRLGIANRQELGRQHHRETPARLEECRGVYEGRRPRRGEAGEAYALRQCGGGRTFADCARDAPGSARTAGCRSPHPASRPDPPSAPALGDRRSLSAPGSRQAFRSEQRRGSLERGPVQIDAGQLPRDRCRAMRLSAFKSLGRSKQKDCLAAGRVQDSRPGSRMAQRPRTPRWREA